MQLALSIDTGCRCGFEWPILTCCVDEVGVKLRCEQGIRQISEELLQQSCDAIDIMIEKFWVGEIHL